MNAIRFEHVDEVFGDAPARALALMDQGLERDAVRERCGQLVAVRDVSLAVPAGEICVLMGLSGSGKSSLLRAINGLNPITRGALTVRSGGEEVTLADCPPRMLQWLRRRGVSMVFQHFALMPWLSVADNVGFGLAAQGLRDAERRGRVEQMLALVGLSRWRDARPDALSGGMQQRVGLARALAVDSDIVLMDEPFSALDPLIREQLQDELLRLQRELGKTVVFVSHDIDEALKLGDSIALLRDGRLVQHGRPDELLRAPADDYVRRFVARANPFGQLAAGLMRPLPPGTQPLCLNRAQRLWLDRDGDGLPLRARRDGVELTLQAWRPGEPLARLGAAPTLVEASLGLREALALFAHTGCELLLAEDGRLVGVLGGAELAGALLPGAVR